MQARTPGRQSLHRGTRNRHWRGTGSNRGLRREPQEVHDKSIRDDNAAATLKHEAARDAELVKQWEDALDATEQKMRADGDALSELRSKVAVLERERDHAEKTRTDCGCREDGRRYQGVGSRRRR
jgi:hypothetical protein